MVAALDEAVGNVTGAFQAKSPMFWEQTLVVFTTDNGGIGQGNNWPLRGRKATLWEGGTRAVGFVRGAGIAPHLAGSVSHAMMHAVDWLPTLAAAVGAPIDPGTMGIDGVDLWPEQ